MDKKLTLNELQATLRQLKAKKSPGPDAITNEMFTHLCNTATCKLLEIFNHSWATSTLPQTWREATMIPILKKRKDHKQAASYRPISLTSCVGNTMKRVVNQLKVVSYPRPSSRCSSMTWCLNFPGSLGQHCTLMTWYYGAKRNMSAQPTTGFNKPLTNLQHGQRTGITVNKDKSSTTLFTLSPKKQASPTKIGTHTLKEEDKATYLGVTTRG